MQSIPRVQKDAQRKARPTKSRGRPVFPHPLGNYSEPQHHPSVLRWFPNRTEKQLRKWNSCLFFMLCCLPSIWSTFWVAGAKDAANYIAWNGLLGRAGICKVSPKGVVPGSKQLVPWLGWDDFYDLSTECVACVVCWMWVDWLSIFGFAFFYKYCKFTREHQSVTVFIGDGR